jgi:hypothetical protein
MKYIKKLNIDFDNWDDIHSNKYWYLNCFKYNNNNNNDIYITYIDIDNNNKRNNNIEILFYNIYSKNKISYNIYVNINKIGLNFFKNDINDTYYLISNKDNISLSDISDELLIDFKNKTECNDNIKNIKKKVLKFFLLK